MNRPSRVTPAVLPVPAAALLALLLALPVGAQPSSSAPLPDRATAPRVYHGSARQLRVTAIRVERGPVIDGALDDPVWAAAAVLDSFTHTDPV